MKGKVIIALVALLVISFLVVGLTPKDKKTSTDGFLEERIKALENEIAELKVLLKQDPGGDLKKDVVQDEPKAPLGPRAWTEGARGWDENGVNIWTSVAPLPIYRVGIGTIAPFCELDVNGSIAVSGGIYDGASFGTDDYVLVADGAGAVAWEPSPAGVAGDYIWNQFAAAQNPGDFWINGTGRAGVTTGKYGELNHASYGVYGQYNASNYGQLGRNGYGVYGCGSTYGVYGYYNATNYGQLGRSGYGVYGRGSTYGVYGYGVYGVRGYGTTYGVWGYYNASNYGHVGRNGYGVYGRGSTYGVYGYGSTYGVYGYYSATIFGYIGNSANGVFGVSNSSTGEAAGVYGQGTHDNSVTSAKGIRATATTAPNVYVSIGISSVAGADGPAGWFWGNNKSSGSWWAAPGAGVVGWGRYGLVGITNDIGYGGVFGQATEDGSAGVWGMSDFAEAYLAYYDGITDYGLLVVSGAKSCAMPTSKGHKALFSIESPEVLFVDYGSGKLSNGRASVVLEDTFLEVVAIDASHPYRVVVTPTDACNGVYVIKRDDGFEVVEMGDATSNATFDYQIIAHRKGYEDKRFPEVRLMERDQMVTTATSEAIRNQ